MSRDLLEDDDMADASIVLIAALSDNRCIGRNNMLPWKLPGDLKYFRETTWGKPIIMGRKTWDSLGKPLPGRTNIVVTRQKDFAPEGARVVSSVDEAVAVAQSIALIEGVDEVMVIGGGEIFTQTLAQADKLYLTEVHAHVEGDAFFPDVDMSQYQETSRQEFAASGDNPYPFDFVRYTKLRAGD